MGSQAAADGNLVATWSSRGLTDLSASDREGLGDFWSVYDANYEAIVDAAGPHLAEATRKAIKEEFRVVRSLRQQAFSSGDWEPLIDHLKRSGASYGHLGQTFLDWYKGITGFRAVLLPYLEQAFANDPRRYRAAVNAMNRYLDFTVAVMGDGYVEMMRELIQQSESERRRQQQVIRELSTPVLKVSDRLLIMPLIGEVDAARARQMTAELLTAIRTHRARAVVIDVTGVPSLTRDVANALIQTTEAARLLGAVVVLTGVSRAVAQSVVQLGVELGSLLTLGDLQSGIEEARKVAQKGTGSDSGRGHRHGADTTQSA